MPFARAPGVETLKNWLRAWLTGSFCALATPLKRTTTRVIICTAHQRTRIMNSPSQLVAAHLFEQLHDSGGHDARRQPIVALRRHGETKFGQRLLAEEPRGLVLLDRRQ